MPATIEEVADKMGAAGETRAKGKKAKPPENGGCRNMVGPLADLLGPQVDLCPELEQHLYAIDGLGPCLKHPLYFSVPHFPQFNGMANKGLAQKKKMIAEYRKKKEWAAVIAAHEKPYRFEALEEIENEITRDQFWELLADVYIGCENWHEEPNRQLMLDWLDEFYRASPGSLRRFTIRQAAMEKHERKAFKKLSGKEPLRVFRGWSRDGGELGFSWTLNQKKAEWFGGRMAKYDNAAGFGYVAWGWVRRNDCLGYFTRRNEDELFAHWDRVTVSSIDIPRFCQPIEVIGCGSMKGNAGQEIASFDFDGTLHSRVDGDGHPLDFDSDRLTPRLEIIAKLRQHAAAGQRIVIVTRRDYEIIGPVLRFIAKHRLPVATIYPTYDKAKEPYLETLKAAVHYDDQEIHYQGAVRV